MVIISEILLAIKSGKCTKMEECIFPLPTCIEYRAWHKVLMDTAYM